MTSWLWWTTTAFASDAGVPPRPADCPPSPLEVATRRAAEVEAAYLANDLDAFDLAAEELARIIGCIDAAVDVDTAVDLHHAMGLRAFAARDPAAAARSLRAIRLLDPAWRPTAGWLGDGQTLDRLYHEELPHQLIPLSVHGDLRVDGRATDVVPANEAFVLQLVDRRMTAIYTGYHLSVTTVPDFEGPNRTRGVVRVVGTSVGAGLLGGALISEVAAANARTALRDPATPTEDLGGLYSQANTLETVAVGLGIGTAATLGLTWVIPW